MATAINYVINLASGAAVRATAALQTGLQGVASAAARLGQASPLGGLTGGLGAAGSRLAGLQGNIAGLASAFGGLQTIAAGAAVVFAKSAIDAANKAEGAFKGLESVANNTGIGIEGAWKAVLELTADGILSQTEAAEALKNLFATGFDLSKAKQMLSILKDTSAFLDHTNIAWGERIVNATVGIKNGQSDAFDNGGIQKNLSVIYEDYAKSIKSSTDALDEQDKVTAVLSGSLVEAANNIGDAKKALSGNQGAAVALAKSYGDLNRAIGKELSPGFAAAQNSAAGFLASLLPLVPALSKVAKGAATAFMNLPVVSAVRFGAAGLQGLAGKVSGTGSPLPPLTPSSGVIPPLPAGAKLPPLAPGLAQPGQVLRGPTLATEVVKDNIDAEKQAKRKADAAEKKAKNDALKGFASAEKALALSKKAADDELAVFKAGLSAQKAALDESLAQGGMSRVAATRATAVLETQELSKEAEVRATKIAALEKQFALAKATGDGDKQAEAQAALNSELEQQKVAASRLQELNSKNRKEERAASLQDADERERITATLLQARQNAERVTGEAIRDTDLTETESLYAQKLLTEEEYIKRSTALKDKALTDELARIREQQTALAQKNPGSDPTKAADLKAEGLALAASATALESKRKALNSEANTAIYESTAKLTEMRQELDQQLLEAEGKSFKARTAQIDAWLAAKRLEFAALPAMLAKAEAVAAAQQKGNRFDKAQEGVNTVNADYSRQAADAQRLNGAGKMTDIGLDIENVRLAKEQVVVLRERLAVLKENANASPAQVEAIATLESQILDLDATMSATAESINKTFFSAMEQGFQDVFTGAKTPLEALKGVVASTLSAIAAEFLKFAMQKAVLGAFGGAGGGIGGAVMSIFGGARAKGGDVDGSKAYLIGEKGPELMFPGLSGRVVSNAEIQRAMGGMMTQQRSSPFRGLAQSREPAAQAGNTSVHVAPKVQILTRDLLDGLMQEPGLEQFIVEASIRNGNKIRRG